MKVLITSGGTKVPIDSVRHIANMSSGNFGSKIATEILRNGHEVVFMRRKGSKSPMSVNIDLMEELYDMYKFSSWFNERMGMMSHYGEVVYETFDGYAEKLELLVREENFDVIILAAAVSDYGVKNYTDGKIRSNDSLSIQLKPLPKLISRVKSWSPKSKLVGFKLLVDSTQQQLIEASQKSIDENNCDMVVANDLRDIKNNQHKLLLVRQAKFGLSVDEYPSLDSDPNFLAKVVAKSIENL